MLLKRRKDKLKSGVGADNDSEVLTTEFVDADAKSVSLYDSFKFILFCLMLAIPIYAISVSVIKNDWIMVAIDTLLVPVGFVHGLLLLFDFVS